MQDGVFGGTPHAIAQTTDGYIWIGTDAGLVRFDGVTFTPWEPPEDKRSAISSVYALLGGRDGRLWIGSARGLAALKDNRLTEFSNVQSRINAIVEDHAGTVWVSLGRAPEPITPVGSARWQGSSFDASGIPKVWLFRAPVRLWRTE